MRGKAGKNGKKPFFKDSEAPRRIGRPGENEISQQF
jgi:hypothetical protein